MNNENPPPDKPKEEVTPQPAVEEQKQEEAAGNNPSTVAVIVGARAQEESLPEEKESAPAGEASPTSEDETAKTPDEGGKEDAESVAAESAKLPPIVRVLGVKFRRAGKTYFFNAGTILYSIGEQVIVETERGLALARVVTPVLEVPSDRLPPDLKRVIRKAHWNDLERDRKNREREEEARRFCEERIRSRQLAMKLVQVEFLHDASKAIFYFTAEQRVDFRDLVKDLAHELHTRIEMRQIGVRDESKLVGGLGPCGREICCASFLTDFSSVSVRMAKDQNLAMNPTKVSGLCGRLMCCLAYEHELYQEEIKKMPKKGKAMVCSLGPCRVVDLNVLTQKVMVELESGKIQSVPLSDLRPLEKAAEEIPAPEPEEEELAAIMESDDPRLLEQLERSEKEKGAEKRGGERKGALPHQEKENHHASTSGKDRGKEPEGGEHVAPPDKTYPPPSGEKDQPPSYPFPPPGRPWPFPKKDENTKSGPLTGGQTPDQRRHGKRKRRRPQ